MTGTKAQRNQRATGNTKALRPPCLRSSGFSFVEVLFAVIILGVGFIMIAAVFPVAIRQTKSTVDETSAATIARAGANYIAANASSTYMISDATTTPAVYAGSMFAIPTYGTTANALATFNLWETIRGNVISQDDPRYAFVSMYFRGADFPPLAANLVLHPYAQVITICVQATETPIFSNLDIRNSTTDDSVHRVNLQPRPVAINIANGAPGDVDLIGFKDSTQTDTWPGAVNAVAEGAFVVIRIDAAVPANNGALVGSIYRVGTRRPDMDGATNVPSFKSTDTTSASAHANFAGEQVWELMPSNDFTPTPASSATTAIEAPAVPAPAGPFDEAWIIGRSVEPNTDASNSQFAGPAMDVSAYSTFVTVH